MASTGIRAALILAKIALAPAGLGLWPAVAIADPVAVQSADQASDAEAQSRERAMAAARKLVEEERKRKQGASIGMTAEQILQSTWGKPKKINVTINASGRHEQWVYSGFQYLYVDNGVLTSIQTNQKSP
jgi:hypothetical protein